MLGPFDTASRSTPPVLHCYSPGVATVDTTTKMSRSYSYSALWRATVATPGEWQCKIDVHNDNDNA